MARRPPRSTLTDTLFPYRTLFRAARAAAQEIDEGVFEAGGHRSEPRLDPVGKRVDLFCPCLGAQHHADTGALDHPVADTVQIARLGKHGPPLIANLFEANAPVRSEEHTSELQSLMRISYAVFCLKKKTDIHI